jgi:serine phosphatase RsbU (regulator of sigma subunit)
VELTEPQPVRAASWALSEILDDIRRRMSTDTATVLLLDRTRTVLEPAAASGLERTLRGARPIPIGKGFAGRIAQTRLPVVLDDVTELNVLNPVLRNHGVHSLLGVPIFSGSELLGVLHVGSMKRKAFGEDDVQRLTQLAAEVSTTLRQRFLDDEHTAALALQRSLLPTTPGGTDGLAMAARYVPAEGELGGDWYDAFRLPGDRLGVVMGDVVGHGLAAAVIMGRLKSVLRAYALEYDDPAEVLTRLDRKICHFERGAYATVLFGVAEAPYEQWRFSSAGHPSPFVAIPGEPAREATLVADPMLGVNPTKPRSALTVTVPDGGALCLFTDGLIERRPTLADGDRDIVAENLERLSTVFSAEDDPEMACIRILSELVGQRVAEDDIALLVAHRQG